MEIPKVEVWTIHRILRYPKITVRYFIDQVVILKVPVFMVPRSVRDFPGSIPEKGLYQPKGRPGNHIGLLSQMRRK